MAKCSCLGMQMCACENNTPLHQAVHTQLWGQGGVSVSGRQRMADGQICKKASIVQPWFRWLECLLSGQNLTRVVLQERGNCWSANC